MNQIQKDEGIKAMSPAAVDQVRQLEATLLAAPQIPVQTRHVLHGGMYARTVTLPAGCSLTGALVRVPTLLVLNGCARVYLGDGDCARFDGHGVVPASAGRKQAFIAETDTDITMVFATRARTVEDAENELTDEADLLVSRTGQGRNTVLVTGE